MDQMAMANAVMAFQRQAGEMIAATKAGLAPFSADLQAEIAAQAAAHPFPPGHEQGQPGTPEEVEAAQKVAQAALSAEYPPNGFEPDDPRIAPVEGIALPIFAIAAKAIGWSTDEPFQDRVLAALGVDPATWRRAGEIWTKKVTEDVVLATFYGQLFSQA